jgi:hypothetical protein
MMTRSSSIEKQQQPLPVRPRGRPRKYAPFPDGLPSNLTREERIIILRNEASRRYRDRKRQQQQQQEDLHQQQLLDFEKRICEQRDAIEKLLEEINLFKQIFVSCPYCTQAVFLSQLQLQRTVVYEETGNVGFISQSDA